MAAKRFLSRRWFLTAALILLVVGAGAAAGVMRAGAKPPSSLALIPGNFAALNSSATVRPALPSQAPGPAPGYAPSAGTLHALGHGNAFAWIHNSAVCWTAGIAGGCADPSPSTEHGIDITLSDADLSRQGEPAEVSGLAVDDVVRVTATLKDGTMLSATPTNNWYEITLPSEAATWDVTRVAAQTRSGRTLSQDVNLQAPAVSQAR
jgi:hypothetical protein